MTIEMEYNEIIVATKGTQSFNGYETNARCVFKEDRYQDVLRRKKTKFCHFRRLAMVL